MATEAPHLPEDDDVLDLAAVYALYGPALRRAIGKSAPAADVEDILHNTFLRLERRCRRGGIDLARPLWPLLLTLAHRARIDHWRTQPTEVPNAFVAVRHASADLPGDELEAVESISEALASLRPRDKRLLLRCVVQEVPRAVVAAEEVLSDGALRLALMRARHRFRTAYLATIENGSLVVWGAVFRTRARLHRLAARGQRDEFLRIGFGASIAAAAVTLAVSSIAMSSVESTQTVETSAAVAFRPSGATVEKVRTADGSSSPTPAQRATPAGTGRGTSPSMEPSSRPSLEVRRIDNTLGTRPDNPSVGFHVEWDDPLGSGHMSAGTEFKCSGGRIATAACPMLRHLPGTAPEDQP